MMTEKKISELLARYEHMLASGKSVYFDADEYDELAEFYEKNEDVELAQNIILQGLAIHPNSEHLLLRRARYMMYDGKYSDALHFLASHFNTYEFELYLIQIECLLNLGLYAEAYELTKTVLDDDEIEVEVALSELGFIYLENEFYDEAILYLTKSLEYNPYNREVLDDLIYGYESKGDIQSAINYCNKVLDIDPYSLETWLTLGKLHSLENSYENAIDALDFALTLDESNIFALKFKAHCLILSGQADVAIDVLKQAIDIYADDDSLYLSLFEAYLELEMYDKMLHVVDDYELQFGEADVSKSKRAYIYMLQGELSTARSIIDSLVENGYDSFDINVIAGEIYSKLNKLNLAMEYFLKALSLSDKATEDILEKLVALSVELGDLEKAVSWQKQIVELSSDDYLSLRRLALLYLEQGNKDGYLQIIDIFTNEQLKSFYELFYTGTESNEEHQEISIFYKNRLKEVFESRQLYKNMKF